MKITVCNGSLLESSADILCYLACTTGEAHSGIARSVRKQYPKVFESYRNDYENGDLRLGHVNFQSSENNQIIASMVALGDPAYGTTDYIAFQKCLDNVMMEAYTLPHKAVIAFPYKIGCGRDGGANWTVIDEMIKQNLKDFDVEYWKEEMK